MKAENMRLYATRVCDELGYKYADVFGKSRLSNLVKLRHCIFSIIRNNTTATLSAIGAAFGFDHATVLHAVVSVNDNQFRPDLKELSQQCLGIFLMYREISDAELLHKEMVDKYNHLLQEIGRLQLVITGGLNPDEKSMVVANQEQLLVKARELSNYARGAAKSQAESLMKSFGVTLDELSISKELNS